MNRRGFIGALTGLPIAAVVQPRNGSPAEVSRPPASYEQGLSTGVMTVCECRRREGLIAPDRDSLADAIGDQLTSASRTRPRC